jgi:hypothetical protein
MTFKKIIKFMFFGLGLALHVEKIIKKADPKILFFLETDLELFRLSLFTCDYKKAVGKRAVVFSIDENTKEYQDSFNKFYTNGSSVNQFLKFSLFSTLYESKINELQSFVVSRSENCYPHEKILFKNHQVLKRIKEGYKFLDLKKKRKETYFKDKPVLVLGAGPSLHKNIQWIKKHQNNFIIICVFSALKILQKYTIRPDIVVQLEEKIRYTVELIKSFDNFDFLNNSIFVFSASAPDALLDEFTKEKIFLIEDRTLYMQDKIRIRSASVGEFSYSLALMFNSYKIYLLGLDLALAEDGSSHSTGHIWKRKFDISKTDEIQRSMSLHNDIMKVKGNFRDEVITTLLFNLSIPLVNGYTQRLKLIDQEVFNMSDGAFFKNMTALKTSNVKQLTVLNKSNFSIELMDTFNKYSKSLSSDDILNNSLHLRRVQLNTFYQHIKKFKKTKTNDAESFMKAYRKLIIDFNSINKFEFRELLTVFILNTASYVSDLFNTNELKNEKIVVKEMKDIYIQQLLKIIDYYRDILEDKIPEPEMD